MIFSLEEPMDALVRNAKDSSLMVSEGMVDGMHVHVLHFMMLLCAIKFEHVVGSC